MPTQEMIDAVCKFIAKEIIAEEDKEKGGKRWLNVVMEKEQYIIVKN